MRSILVGVYNDYRLPLCQERPYHDDNTASRLLSEVKHHRARLVLRWGTTLESRVLFFFYKFSFLRISKYLCMNWKYLVQQECEVGREVD